MLLALYRRMIGRTIGTTGTIGHLLMLAVAAVCAPSCFGQSELPALNIDIAETSISGISSGGFMAVQFQVAHSSIVKGVGVVAGGPYDCSQGSMLRATTQCSCTADPQHAVCDVSSSSAAVATLADVTRDHAAHGLIDAPENLARQRVFLFSGGKDLTVPAKVVDQLEDYYRTLGVPSQNIQRVNWPAAGHTMPTKSYGIACAKSGTPFIGKCSYDGAGNILATIYGPLKPLKPLKAGQRRGKLIQFDQQPYVAIAERHRFLWDSGMDRAGFVYLPAACVQGAACRLHVALHGCMQGRTFLPLTPPPDGGIYYDKTFARHAGYAEWADANNIVMLFPQVVSIPFRNPYGCWDFWGYTGADYATRDGVQIASLRAMVDRLTSGRH